MIIEGPGSLSLWLPMTLSSQTLNPHLILTFQGDKNMTARGISPGLGQKSACPIPFSEGGDKDLNDGDGVGNGILPGLKNRHSKETSAHNSNRSARKVSRHKRIDNHVLSGKVRFSKTSRQKPRFALRKLSNLSTMEQKSSSNKKATSSNIWADYPKSSIKRKSRREGKDELEDFVFIDDDCNPHYPEFIKNKQPLYLVKEFYALLQKVQIPEEDLPKILINIVFTLAMKAEGNESSATSPSKDESHNTIPGAWIREDKRGLAKEDSEDISVIGTQITRTAEDPAAGPSSSATAGAAIIKAHDNPGVRIATSGFSNISRKRKRDEDEESINENSEMPCQTKDFIEEEDDTTPQIA